MKAIFVKLDGEAQDALAELTACGASSSVAISRALIGEARRQWYLRAEEDAKRIAADPADRAEIAAMQAFFA